MKEWHENNNHPMIGKHHSDEAKAKMSEASKEMWKSGKMTEESIRKRGIARRIANYFHFTFKG
jgi:hypothetical protein